MVTSPPPSPSYPPHPPSQRIRRPLTLPSLREGPLPLPQAGGDIGEQARVDTSGNTGLATQKSRSHDAVSQTNTTGFAR